MIRVVDAFLETLVPTGIFVMLKFHHVSDLAGQSSFITVRDCKVVQDLSHHLTCTIIRVGGFDREIVNKAGSMLSLADVLKHIMHVLNSPSTSICL